MLTQAAQLLGTVRLLSEVRGETTPAEREQLRQAHQAVLAAKHLCRTTPTPFLPLG